MLYQTYQNCAPLVGRVSQTDPLPLMPIAHTTQLAHIELTVDMEGRLLPDTITVITDKQDSVTIIPCTEKSQSRGGTKPAAHPLQDKLQYLAGDYAAHNNGKGGDFYREYLTALAEWCRSEYSHPRVYAVWQYLQRGRLIADLAEAGILPRDETGRLIRKWDSKRWGDKQGVFRAAAVLNDALDAFVRIDTRRFGTAEPHVWNDPSVWDSFIRYYLGSQDKHDICYVLGGAMPCAAMSPGKIRNSGDKTKLISSNDNSGFTYRGRFSQPAQVAQIGYETTQKGHNALKWLIQRQGFYNGDQVYVAWGTKNEQLPPLDANTADMMAMLPLPEAPPDTGLEYAKRLNKWLAGLGERRPLEERAQIVVMGLDSATGLNGRLAITYYRELSGSEFLEQVLYWHGTCTWRLAYVKDTPPFVGAPAPSDIIWAAYGGRASDKLKKAAMARLMPCILEKRPLPVDMVRAAARRAANPVAMEPWEYRKTLAIACAMLHKHYLERYKEVLPMPVDKSKKDDPSYLFGRLLAYAQHVENYAQFLSSNGTRQTNAERMMATFAAKPAVTWEHLYIKLTPYIDTVRKKYSGLTARWQDEINEIMDMIGYNGMTDTRLKPTYLVGYAAQLLEFEAERKEAVEKKNKNQITKEAPIYVDVN